jgi:hypothetical protein
MRPLPQVLCCFKAFVDGVFWLILVCQWRNSLSSDLLRADAILHSALPREGGRKSRAILFRRCYANTSPMGQNNLLRNIKS